MQPTIAQALPCPHCGYDLRAIASERCPECGEPIDRDAARRSQIPWTHRRQIGWWRAYWRTVALVLAHPKKLAAEIARPVSYRDAQVFRWVTIFMAAIPSALVMAAWWRSADPWERSRAFGRLLPIDSRMLWFPDLPDDFQGILIVASAAITMLITVTGAQSYFFHPRSLSVAMQNRAIALSYYPS